MAEVLLFHHVRDVGLQAVIDRGVAAAQDLPEELVYAGISLGVLPAQVLAQTRPGARGAVMLEVCVPPEEFGGPWPHDPAASAVVTERVLTFLADR